MEPVTVSTIMHAMFTDIDVGKPLSIWSDFRRSYVAIFGFFTTTAKFLTDQQ